MDNELREGAQNAVSVCMNVGDEDRVFIISDDETLTIGEALKEEALAAGAVVELRRLEEYAPRPITSVPEGLKAHAAAFIPTVTFFAASAQEGELAMRMGLGRSLVEISKVRHGHMVSITEQLMREGMRADYQQVYEMTNKVYELVKDADQMHVASEKGTDLTAQFNPEFSWVPCHGRYHHEGDWGNLPEGEVYTCPATVDGIIVADVLGDYFSPKYGVLDQPVTFTIENGYVVKVDCEDKSLEEEILAYLNSCENGKRVGEFAIGTNTAVKHLTGRLLQDEKIPGVHVAFGNPYPLRTGADWASRVHVDVIPTNCTIDVDGEILMQDGEFVFLNSEV